MVGGATGWLLASGSDVINNTEKAWAWWRIDHTYSGRWSNDAEGHLDGGPPGSLIGENVVELSLYVEDGKVYGDIHNQRLCKALPWQYVMIDGRRLWWGLGGLHIWAWDHLRGVPTSFGDFRVTHDRATDTIEVVTTSPTQLFPEKVRLHRLGEAGTVSDKVHPFCREYLARAGITPEALTAATAARRAAGAASERAVSTLKSNPSPTAKPASAAR